MKNLFIFFVLLGAALIPNVPLADDITRIEEILHNQRFSDDGLTVTTEETATVEGCAIRLVRTSANRCHKDTGFYERTRYIDVRVLNTHRFFVSREDFTGESYENLKGAAAYSFRWHYWFSLFKAGQRAHAIFKEEYENHPRDISTRLQVLSRRNSEEIDPDAYAMSYKTTKFCSGATIKEPLFSSGFDFYMPPEHTREFVALIEDLAKTCEPL
ncbi:hypothetical protein KMP13_00340 [Epibacterium ulvae]|uniref:hypothetical protein n=1 Tax=Epibacterium ulvae TaxID=1156985 RepID=UPI001BFC90C8|nr:hypothetical protein [Epibacterium ulvae]MBT8152371.1 hypothetical protein [Epibacterium ulvae]